MRKIISCLVLAAMIALNGCGAAQNTASPAGNSVEQAAEASPGQSSPEAASEQVTAESGAGQTGAVPAVTEAQDGGNVSDPSAAAGIDEETVTIVIPTVYESVTSQEEAEKIRKDNGYESAVLNEDGSLTIVMSRSQHDEILDQFKKSVDEGITEIIHTVEDSAIEKIEYNDDYSIFTVTVSGEELGLAERQAADELVMYGTLYHIYSGNDVDHIQVDYLSNGTGEVIETADSGSLEKAY